MRNQLGSIGNRACAPSFEFCFDFTSHHKEEIQTEVFPCIPLKKFSDDEKSIVILPALSDSAKGGWRLCFMPPEGCLPSFSVPSVLNLLPHPTTRKPKTASPHTSPQTPPKAPYQSHPKGTLPE